MAETTTDPVDWITIFYRQRSNFNKDDNDDDDPRVNDGTCLSWQLFLHTAMIKRCCCFTKKC